MTEAPNTVRVTANPFLHKRGKRPRRQRARFQSNQEALEAFVAHVASTKSRATTQNRRNRVQRFIDYLAHESIYDQTSDDLLDFFDAIADHCRHYRRGGATHNHTMPSTCSKGRPLDCATCPLREGVGKQTVGQHVVGVNKFYQFLVRLKHLPANPAQAASDEWWEDNKRLVQKERAASGEDNRFLTHAEAVQWVNGSTEIAWATYQLITLRYGFRASEMARLRVDAPSLDPDLEWIRVPLADGNDGKRLVSDPYPIDEEIRRYLHVYLRWRTTKLHASGKTTPHLFITRQGNDYADKPLRASSRVNPSLRRMARVAGLDDPHNVTSHVGRRFFSDRAQERGFFGNRLKLVRGDFLRSEATGRYYDKKRLAELWHDASPPLGVRAPPGYYTP